VEKVTGTYPPAVYDPPFGEVTVMDGVVIAEIVK
jgi:hypothetical protein